MDHPNPAAIFGQRKRPLVETSDESAAYDTELMNSLSKANSDTERKTGSHEHALGNLDLPVAQYRERIVEAVDSSQAVVITAETGAGKSTQVPQFLAEAGYEVVVTQPRVVAARSVAERVRDEVVARRGADFKDFVGYRTARERGDSPENQILFATDGLQLVRELSGHGVGQKQALVLDEVHEWNENMEVLVAWAKQHMKEDADFKVVVMSATMEAEPLARYLSEGVRDVPVIEVPGRTYEVKRDEGGDVADQAIRMAREGKNTLVFVPGKAEIDQVMDEIGRANIPGATILPLHGQLEAAEQRKVFVKYPGVKVVVATNVAQTSVTIEDIDAVVDSGLERTNEVRNGVEGLYLKPISKADCLQRAGRAGRTKEGEYVLAQLGSNRFVSFDEREPYSTPEILRTRLDGMVLRLAKNGFDAAEMDFYHSRDEHGRDIKPEIAAAKERLQKLGALRQDDSITKIGRDMERMPVESHYARMMIEARRYGSEVQIQLAALLAIQEANGIIQFSSRNKPCAERWRGLLAYGYNDSDMIKQLEVFVAAQSMSDKQKRDHDIYIKACSKARETLRQLRGVEKLQDQDLTSPSAEQRKQLVACIVSGMVDHLYLSDWRGYHDANGHEREVSTRSIIQPEKMVVGVPFDLEIDTRWGRKVLSLIESPTNIPSIELLRDVAPQLFTERPSGYVVDDEGLVHERFEQIFNDHATGEFEDRIAAESEGRSTFIAVEAARRYWQSSEVQDVLRIVDDLQQRSGEALQTISCAQLEQALLKVLPSSVASLPEASQYLPKFTIHDLVSKEDQERIRQASPATMNGFPLRYESGRALIDFVGVVDDVVLALDGSQYVLPDGRSVGCSAGGWRRWDSISDYQDFILAERERRATAERANFEREVDEAVRYLASGWTDEQLTQYYQQPVIERANQVASEIRARYHEQQRRRQEGLTEVNRLLELASAGYDDTIFDRLHDLPSDLRQEMYRIQSRFGDTFSRLERARVDIESGRDVDASDFERRLLELANDLSVCRGRYQRWEEDQRRRETGQVSAKDLDALLRHFNTR